MTVRRESPRLRGSVGTSRVEDRKRARRHVEDPRPEDPRNDRRIRACGKTFMNDPG